MRYGRVIVNLVIVGACACLIALEIAGPGNPAPTGRPTDTFTHLDVKVDDRGVHIPVRNVAAGNVEITLTDARTHKANPLTVTSNPRALSLAPGTQLATLRTLTTYQLSAYAAGKKMPGSGAIAVVMPQLGAPREPSDRVTITLDATGMNTPYRDARFDKPLFAGPTNATDAVFAWTAVGAGATRLVIRNHSHRAATCAVDDGAATALPSGASRTVQVALARGDNVVQCGATKLDLVAS
jgi:hypothetical protein